MNICVYGAASSNVDHFYSDIVEDFCEKLAHRGHNLVFGAGNFGMMGAAARGFHKGGAKVTGVVPNFFKYQDVEPLYDRCDELIYTEDLKKRKEVMEARADAFLIAPGGIGTFDEFFEALVLRQLVQHNKQIALFSIRDYYEPIKMMMDKANRENFLRPDCMSLFGIFNENQEEELITYLETIPEDRDTVSAFVRG